MGCCCCFDFLWYTLFQAPLTTLILILVPFYFWRRRKWNIAQEAREKWTIPSREKLILHGPPRVENAPGTSPFVMKLECYLRMAKIPYDYDDKDGYKGPKRKTPWISYKGVHIGDSSLIIEYLKRIHNIDIHKGVNYSKKEWAGAFGLKRMFEEHYFWAYAKWVWIDGIKYLGEPKGLAWLPLKPFQAALWLLLWLQGVGLHSQAEFVGMMEDDLRAFSDFLGDNKYFMGDSLTELDATAFGFIAGTILRLKNSPYQRLIEKELPNLKAYFERMKAEFWPDWEKTILGSKDTRFNFN